MSEIESRLYDKFIVTVTEVKVLLAESGKFQNKSYILYCFNTC